MIRSFINRIMGRLPRPDPERDVVAQRLSDQERRLRDLVREQYRRSEERLREQSR